jgi:magnesium chelatase subunit I
VDAILDAAAQGRTFVRRGAMVRLYPSRFMLIGSMNPEEGRLRPQILDRFGLRVWTPPLTDSAERLEATRRVRAFQANPTAFRARYATELARMQQSITAARTALPEVQPTEAAEHLAVELVSLLDIPSQRAEIVLLEAARAVAALDRRTAATSDDVRQIAPMVLRHRRSAAIQAEAQRVAEEDAAIQRVLDDTAVLT